MTESFREALARLLQEAAATVGHGFMCDSTLPFDVGPCSCDYAQRVREKQAAVMEAAIRRVTFGPGEHADALAAGQAHLTTEGK